MNTMNIMPSYQTSGAFTLDIVRTMLKHQCTHESILAVIERIDALDKEETERVQQQAKEWRGIESVLYAQK